MESCYVNTGHPDFLNGHQAIALVNEQLQSKNQSAAASTGDAKQERRTPQQLALQTNQQPATPTGAGENGFFGSFFSGGNKAKKLGGMMDAVSMSKDSQSDGLTHSFSF
jgi:dynamin 1-like protein